MNPAVFQENRASFSREDLTIYQGQWVAFSSDGRRIIASAADLNVLNQLIISAGEDPEQAALERVELDDICLGGAELL